MSENTAKITDPIWDSRNSEEPDWPPKPCDQRTPEQELAYWKTRAERAEAILSYTLECWGSQINSLRKAYESACKTKI